MTSKIKVFVGFLALVALFSVYNVFNSLSKKTANFTTKNLSGTLSFAIDEDTDKDGLTNKEESYWNTDFQNPDTDGDGFVDGEEVASGHDPTKHGSDDKIFTNNLTERLSNLTLSGIVEGSLRPDNPNFNKSVNLVIDDILLQSDLKTSAQTPKLKIVKDTPENIKQYAITTLPFIKSMFQEEGSRINQLFSILETVEFFNEEELSKNGGKYTNLLRFLEAELPKIQNQIEFLRTSEVPKYMENSHLVTLNFFQKLNDNYSLLRAARQDPIQAMISLNNIINMFMDDLPELLTNYYQ